MMTHVIILVGLLGVLTGLLPVGIMLVLRRPVTRAAYVQFGTAAALGLFFVLSFWPNGPRFDRLVGMPGAAWLIYQTALVATALGEYTILTVSLTKDWQRWRWRLLVGLTLVAIFWVAGIVLARMPHLDHTYLFYEVAAGRPLPSLIMNVAVGVAVAWGSFLCVGICRQLRRTAQLIKERRWAGHILTLASLGMVLGILYVAQALLSLATGNDAGLFPLMDSVGLLIVLIWLGRLAFRVVLALPAVRTWFLAELEPDQVQLGERIALNLAAISDLNRLVYDQAVHLSEYADRGVVLDMETWCLKQRVSRYEHDYLHLAASIFTLNRSHIDGLAYQAPDPDEVRAADEELASDAEFRSDSDTYAAAEAGRVLHLVLGTSEDWRREPAGVRREGAAALVNILRAHKLLDGGPFTPPAPFLTASSSPTQRNSSDSSLTSRRRRSDVYPVQQHTTRKIF